MDSASEFQHGVEYHPSTIKTGTLSVDKLEQSGIGYIRFQWIDFTNIVRFRIMPVSYFKKLLEGNRPGIAVAKVTLGIVYLSVASGFSPMGEYLVTPDLSTIRPCPYEPGHASLIGWFEEKAGVTDSQGQPTVQVDLCPRGMLRRIVEEAKTASNVDFLVGFETEFILLKSTNPIEPISIHAWTSADALRSGSTSTKVVAEMVHAIELSGIEVQICHGEAAPGQFEIVTGPLSPLQAADALVHTREVIYNVAAKHGLRATFAPRIYMNSTGSAAHTHISVHSGRVKKDSQLSSVEKSFLAGVMAHLPSLPALTLPIPASYKRVNDGVWSGGTYVCWGTENREAPVRVTNSASPSSRRFEMRYIDGTSNPYLVLAGILGAGHLGIRSNLELTISDCPGPISAAQMSEDERRALGISKRLPLSWNEARENFASDTEFSKILGTEFQEKYLSVNKTLAEALDQDEDETKKLERLVLFY